MPVRKQHLVSEVILRRFADANGQILRIDLKSGKMAPRHPAACMYELDFISAASDEAEALWKTVEDRMWSAYVALENGAADQDPDAIATIKDCIALHFIRSHTIKYVAQQSSRSAIQTMLNRLMGEEGRKVDRNYLEENKIILAGPQGREFAARKLLATVEPALSSPDEFWKRVRDQFQNLKAWCAPLQLEILTPKDDAGDFLIGDTPALSYEAGNLMGGPKAGVTLDRAAAVYMPLSPRYVVSLAVKGGRYAVERPLVALVNQMQILNAHKQICSRTTSQIVAWNIVPQAI
jgi:hypothetical protein